MPPGLADLLYWITVIALAVATLGTVIVATWLKKNDLITIAAGLLSVDLVLAAFPVAGRPPTIGILLGVLSLAISVLGGGLAATYALRLATRGSVPSGIHGGILVAADDDDSDHTPPRHEVLRGGTTIGYLERVAVTASLIAGFPEAIAVIIAIKGVGRFTELAAAEARERFIIGTLASLIWACASAALVLLSGN